MTGDVMTKEIKFRDTKEAFVRVDDDSRTVIKSIRCCSGLGLAMRMLSI